MAKPKLEKTNLEIFENTGVVSGNLLLNAYDPDGDTITIARVNDGVVGGSKGSTVFEGVYGFLTIQQNGDYTYTLNSDVDVAFGSSIVENFKIKVRDGTGNYDQDNLIITINGVEDAPALTKSLVNGLGGPAGFGENYIVSNAIVDISPVFENGLNLGVGGWHEMFVNYAGEINIGPGVLYAHFYGSFDRGPTIPTPGGTSTGSGMIWYDVDAQTDTVTITWDDLAFSRDPSAGGNAFQLQLHDAGSGRVEMTLRYEDLLSGEPGGFVLPTNQAVFGHLSSMIGNTGIEGVWQYTFQDGQLLS